MLKGLSTRYLLSLFLCLASINSASATTNLFQWMNPEIYVAGGAVSSRLYNNKYVTINDVIVNRYDTWRQTTWNGTGGIGVAYYFGAIMNSAFSASLGAAAYATSFGNIKGIEYPFINDGIYDTLNYKFHVKSDAIFAEGRLFYTCYSWQPYFLVGLGASWNRLSHYIEIPSNESLSAAAVSSQFGSQSHTPFAFELGLGIQHQLYEDRVSHVRYSAALDYRYFNFGKGILGHFPAQTAQDNLKIQTISAQGVMVTLKASFC